MKKWLVSTADEMGGCVCRVGQAAWRPGRETQAVCRGKREARKPQDQAELPPPPHSVGLASEKLEIRVLFLNACLIVSIRLPVSEASRCVFPWP